MTYWGIFFIGLVFGYLLFYGVRHTANFSIELLSASVGAVGGAAVVGFVGQAPGWIGPYGIGLAVGFIAYLIFALVLIFYGKFGEVAGTGVLLVGRNLLGFQQDKG